MRLLAFDKNRITNEHDFMVFDKPYNYNIILGEYFLRNIGMNLNYRDLSIEWLGNAAPMDSLNTPQMVAKEVESYLYQMDLEDEGLSDLEAYASSILYAKYENVDIEDLIK